MDPGSLGLGAMCGLAVATAGGVFFLFRRSRDQGTDHAAELQAAMVRERQVLEAERERGREELSRERASQEQAAVQRRQDEILQAREQLETAQTAQREALAAQRQELEEQQRRADRRDALLSGREEALGARERLLGQREEALVRSSEVLSQTRERLDGREAAVSTTMAEMERQRQVLGEREAAIAARSQEIDQALAAIARLTPAEAKAELLGRLERDLGAEMGERLARHQRDLTARSRDLAIEIIGRAVQRYAAEHTAQTTVSQVRIPDEEMKGRVIGRDGRNIKAFEQATGVDLIIDETPLVVAISCFSGVRREIARRTLVQLIEDGRIHPARIEEVLAEVERTMDLELITLGEDAAFACDVSGLHPQLIKLLGKLHYRTSYGQNVLAHTQEVAHLCGAMAADLGLDPRLGRRCGLLHDIGKAIDHEQEGSHPVLGHEALKRYGESEIVANAALAHHEGQVVISPYTTLAAASDAISAARPGARRENAERFIKRMEQLEQIACAVNGVHKAYAIQAGRELRVIVHGHSLPDSDLGRVAHDIARRIENEVTFPGEVKVTVIRETRQVAVAR